MRYGSLESFNSNIKIGKLLYSITSYLEKPKENWSFGSDLKTHWLYTDLAMDVLIKACVLLDSGETRCNIID